MEELRSEELHNWYYSLNIKRPIKLKRTRPETQVKLTAIRMEQKFSLITWKREATLKTYGR